MTLAEVHEDFVKRLKACLDYKVNAYGSISELANKCHMPKATLWRHIKNVDDISYVLRNLDGYNKVIGDVLKLEFTPERRPQDEQFPTVESFCNTYEGNRLLFFHDCAYDYYDAEISEFKQDNNAEILFTAHSSLKPSSYLQDKYWQARVLCWTDEYEDGIHARIEMKH